LKRGPLWYCSPSARIRSPVRSIDPKPGRSTSMPMPTGLGRVSCRMRPNEFSKARRGSNPRPRINSRTRDKCLGARPSMTNNFTCDPIGFSRHIAHAAHRFSMAFTIRIEAYHCLQLDTRSPFESAGNPFCAKLGRQRQRPWPTARCESRATTSHDGVRLDAETGSLGAAPS